jgi:hypothetical protein
MNHRKSHEKNSMVSKTIQIEKFTLSYNNLVISLLMALIRSTLGQ